MLEEQNLRGSPGRIPTRDPSRREDPGGEEDDEAKTHKSRSSLIDHRPRNLMTSMDGLHGTFNPNSSSWERIDNPADWKCEQLGTSGDTFVVHNGTEGVAYLYGNGGCQGDPVAELDAFSDTELEGAYQSVMFRHLRLAAPPTDVRT